MLHLSSPPACFLLTSLYTKPGIPRYDFLGYFPGIILHLSDSIRYPCCVTRTSLGAPWFFAAFQCPLLFYPSTTSKKLDKIFVRRILNKNEV